jgi:hypothetical protein
MNNQNNERQRVLKAGVISFQGSKVDCAIHNISVGGANLEVNSALPIPDSFDLAINAEDGNQRCHVVWRKEGRMGVAFS